MQRDEQFKVFDLPSLEWPASLTSNIERFSLFVAADTLEVSVEEISVFAKAALHAGLAYSCTWGEGCERFHDIIDECIAEDEGTTRDGAVITTWHHETLEQALEFFSEAVPVHGSAGDGKFRVVICVGRPDWAAKAESFLGRATDLT